MTSSGSTDQAASESVKNTGGVLSRTVVSTAGMAVQGIARFVYTLVIGRLAGPEALGDTSALLSVAVYLSLVLPAGLGVAASRYLPVPGTAGHAVHVLNRWFWGSSISLALAALPIAWWISGDLAAAVGCAVLVWAYNAYVYTRGAMMGEDRILQATITDLVSSLIAITALVLVLIGEVHWALLLPLALGYVVFATVSRPKTTGVKPDPLERAVILRFVRDATIGGLATGGLLPATMVFVRAYDTPLQAGLFAAALSLATPANMISQAINQVLIPHFARLSDDPAAMRSSHRRLLGATVTLFALVFGLLIVLAEFVLSLLYGDVYMGGTEAMQALLIVVFLISATCAPSAYLVASGHQRAFAVIWVLAFLTGAVTMVTTSPAFGMWGALLGFGVGGGGGSIAVIVAALVFQPRR